MGNFPFFPDQASTVAGQVDLLFFALVGLATLFALLVATFVVFFAIRYRRGAQVDRSNPITSSMKLELTWSIIPLVLGLGVFTWGAQLYFDSARAPANAMEINVVGKQWMWYIQHPEGRREINELHIPVGQPVRLKMISQDVIHSFFVPAFRIKQDVLPGRYTTKWFQATKTGEFHLFCAEYCGTDHSRMIGRVIVMTPADYQAWLSTAAAPIPEGGAQQAATIGGELSMAEQGAQLFAENGCNSCHKPDGSGVGPSLVGVFGQQVSLQGGGTTTVDDNYIRESIVNPEAKVVAGYNPVMPSFQGQLTETEILQLTAYIKSLGENNSEGKGQNQ